MGLGPYLASFFLAVSIASAAILSKGALDRNLRFSQVSDMVAGEAVPGLLTQVSS